MPDTSIFSIQPPEWMQQRATFQFENAVRDSEMLGQTMGNVAASAISAGINPKDSKQNFLSRWSDAYHQIQDPMYDIKRKQGELSLEATKSDLLSENFKLDQQKNEAAAWQKDLPELSPWMTLTPEQRLDKPAPAVTSQKGLEIQRQVEQNDERIINQKQANKIRADNSKAQLTAGQRAMEWANAFASASPETQAKIAALGNDAYETDAYTGRKLPSLEAITILNQDRTAQGKPPFGASAAEVTAFSREQVAKTNAAAKADAMKLAQQYKIDLEKYKSDLKMTEGGKMVSKQEFINRQFHTMLTDIYNSWDAKKNGPYDGKQAADLAQQILGDTYDKFSTGTRTSAKGGTPTPPPVTYKSKDDVKAAFEAGTITKEQAIKILETNFANDFKTTQ